ncbi:hypothetical protein Ccrd_019980, partial [Cynara cardunculus var. scolymus]
MADFGGFPINQHQRRVRKKSERIMMKTYFSNFKNTIDNPVDVDAEAELERTNAQSSNEQGSSKGKEAEVEQTYGVPRPAHAASKGKDLKVTKPIVQQTRKQAARVGKVPERSDNQECIIMMGERIVDLRSSRTETDMLLQGYVERFSGDKCFDQFKQELARMFKDNIWETRQDEGQRSDKVLTVVD